MKKIKKGLFQSEMLEKRTFETKYQFKTISSLGEESNVYLDIWNMVSLRPQCAEVHEH
jgi:hypothetical protein